MTYRIPIVKYFVRNIKSFKLLRCVFNARQYNRSWISYDPALIPPPALMATEGMGVLEEWFRWSEEWSMLLKVYGAISSNSAVFEIGCGLGRIAFPLRFILSSEGSYNGLDITKEKINFLDRTFHKEYPNFHFLLGNIHNTNYNPRGKVKAVEYCFPYGNDSFDIIFAASVFTHLLPEAAQHYFKEAARVLKPGGRCLFSFFLLDYYEPGQPRPYGFAHPMFNFDYEYGNYGKDFAVVDRNDPEKMTAYRLELINKFIQQAGLKIARMPIQGMWSGSTSAWISTQDLIVLEK